MNRRPLSAIVLAAGEGTRMRSGTPKPLHRLCGRPMVLYVLDALAALTVERVVVVVGHGATEVVKTIQAEAPRHLAIEFVEQFEPRGTGDAVAVALTGLSGSYGAADFDESDVIVLPGDTPLLGRATLSSLVEGHRVNGGAATLLTARLDQPNGYSRIVRDKDGRVARIVDEPDATEQERLIDEVATTVYCFRHGVLAPALRRLSPYNSLGEYYLTDTIAVLHDAGYAVTTVVVPDPVEALEVNDRAQLAAAEAELRARINKRWMRRGVTMWDPERTYLDVSVGLAADVTLLPGVILEGSTTVGVGAVLGPSVHLVDCEVASGATISHTVASNAVIGEHCSVGPYVVLEKGTRLERGERRGPFFAPGADGTS
ncbi:MAG: NTP transferase domain-containing protein [Acidimicrobiales bacterium]|jgi:bifunctional UDP-N-acetylglucosamine pyrophosphorylase/glucosamine-1-phosphate N-acetyltransferase